MPHSIYRKGLQIGVAAAIEHESILQLYNFQTIVDIGANKGQFALTSRHCFPNAKIISFEPLSNPAEKFTQLFVQDKNTSLHKIAIAPKKEKAKIHISKSEDSSSLLPISELQNQIFPNTHEIGTTIIDSAPLQDFITTDIIDTPALLKLDVQGFEVPALQGCESLLSSFSYIYCECSFMELYTGQKVASDVIAWLYKRGFILVGTYNMSYNSNGQAIQADFMFQNTAT